MEYATWTLVGVTCVLALATVAYAYTTWKLYKASNDQIEALKKLTEAVIRLWRPY